MKIVALVTFCIATLDSSIVFAAECTVDELTEISTIYSEAMTDGTASCPDLTATAYASDYCSFTECLRLMSNMLDALPDCTSAGINVKEGLKAAIDLCEGRTADTFDILTGTSSSKPTMINRFIQSCKARSRITRDSNIPLGGCDNNFESVRKMVGIFGGDALRSMAAATPAEQVELIKAFDTYEGGLIAHVQGLQTPVAEVKPAQPKPLRLKVNPYEGKEGENLHFWVREVELAMDAALISTERLRVAYALSNLGGRAKTWAYTREATTPGCFTTWAQLCQQLRAAFLPANYEYRKCSRFLACKQGKRELHEYIQEMRATMRRQAQYKELQQLELAPGRESLGALETRKSSGGLLVVHASPVARNGDKYADALRESEGRGQVSVRVADGTLVNVPGVWMDLAVKFEDFDSTGSFLVLDMDKYDLILGMPWLEKHEPWIDWRGKAIGAIRPQYRALVSNVPTSVRDWGARDGRQGAYVPEEVLGVTDSNEDVAMSLATGHKAKAHFQACGIAMTSPNAESRRAVWASTVAVPDGTDQAGNIETKKNESTACVSSVGNEVSRGVKKTSTSAEVSLITSLRAGAVHLEALPEVSALLNLEELSMKDFLAELKAGEIAEMGFTKQRATRLGSEILKNSEDPVYPLVKEYSDVVSKHP
ncbi:Elicitin, partial [Phytophthora palmivora]